MKRDELEEPAVRRISFCLFPNRNRKFILRDQPKLLASGICPYSYTHLHDYPSIMSPC